MFPITELEDRGVSVVLGSYNRYHFLTLTIASIRDELELSGIPYEIIVVDGGSTDGTMEWLAEQKDIITIIQHNRGEWRGKPVPRRTWGYFINLGFRSAHGKFICMLSDDCLVIPGAIQNGYHFFENNLQNGENSGAVPFFWRDWPIMQDYAVNLCYGIPNLNHGLYLRSALEEIRFADEETHQFYRGDVDIIFRLITHGYTIKPSNSSYIEHYSHANVSSRTSNLLISVKDKESFIKRWKNEGINIPGLDWDKGDESIKRNFDDSMHTVKLFYPYCRTYRLGKATMNIWNSFKNIFGEARINKLWLDRFKRYLENTENVHLKKIEYIAYNMK